MMSPVGAKLVCLRIILGYMCIIVRGMVIQETASRIKKKRIRAEGRVDKVKWTLAKLISRCARRRWRYRA